MVSDKGIVDSCEANMRYETISEIYEANDKIRARLKETLAGLTDEQIAALPEGEKWTIGQIAEHVSMVGNGIYRICAKLLSKAEAGGRPAAGAIDLNSFAGKAREMADLKLEAPAMVHPTGTRTVGESLQALEDTHEALRELRPLFEKYDVSEYKFPHPYAGDMSAIEWLVMYGGHEGRHLAQIRRVLEKLG